MKRETVTLSSEDLQQRARNPHWDKVKRLTTRKRLSNHDTDTGYNSQTIVSKMVYCEPTNQMACSSVTQLYDPCYLYLGICVAHPGTQLKEIWHSKYGYGWTANFWLLLTCTSQMQPGLLCPPFTRAARLSFKTPGFLTYKRPEMDHLAKEASWLEVRDVCWILIIQSKIIIQFNMNSSELFNSIISLSPFNYLLCINSIDIHFILKCVFQFNKVLTFF